MDPRIPEYTSAAEALQQGHYDVEVSLTPQDDLSKLGQALRELGHTLEKRYQETQHLGEITAHINAGLLLDEILDALYREFRGLIPYNRIGFSLIEADGQTLRAYWAKTDQVKACLTIGYSAPIAGSSLETILRTGRPRIINDLEQYAKEKPQSKSTQLILAEGIRSSLTCPLIANGVPVGFMFFSSTDPNAYADVHVELFQQISGQLSIMVEKGRLVSALAAQKRAIEIQNQRLQEVNDLKNAFLGMAAHDLRNPLGNVQMALYLLSKNDLALTTEKRQMLFDNALRQTEYMLGLLNDLLDISHIESGKFTLNPIPIAVEPFLSETVQWHNSLAQTKSSVIVLDVKTKGEVNADPVRLRQIMDNLISNAVKYSPPGSTIEIRAERDSESWRIEVEDEGPGLSANDKQRLFQTFTRLSAQPTGGEKSTGLGLAITRRIVEAQGGTINVNSIPGEGATFWFSLPCLNEAK